MGNFNRDRGGRGGGFNRGGDRRGGFNRDRGDRPAMHKAVCDSCHKNCEVPFKPTNNKPIYCSDCFGKQGGLPAKPAWQAGGSRDRGGDTRLPVRQGRPRFEDRSSGGSNNESKEILKGIKSLNYKLDELLKALSPNANTEAVEEKKFNEGPKPSGKPAKKGAKKKTTPKKVAKKKTPKKKAVAKKPTKKTKK